MKEISMIIKTDKVYSEFYQFNNDINIETADGGKRLIVSKDDVDIYGIKVNMYNALVDVVRIIKKEIDGIKFQNEHGQTASIKTSQCGAELTMNVSCAYFRLEKISDYAYQVHVEIKFPIVELSER